MEIRKRGANLVDVADDGKGSPLAGDNKLKHAMVRIAFDQDGTPADQLVHGPGGQRLG